MTEKNKKKQEAEERARLLERRSKYVSAESNASEQLYREGQSISNSLNIAREIESTGRGIISITFFFFKILIFKKKTSINFISK